MRATSCLSTFSYTVLGQCHRLHRDTVHRYQALNRRNSSEEAVHVPARFYSPNQEWHGGYIHDRITPNIWTPNSLDLNLMDHYVWIVVERETNKYTHNIKDLRKSALRDVMANIDKEHLINACNHFKSCIEAVIEVDCGYIE